MKTAYKFRLYPKRVQEAKLNLTLETCRHFYNNALAARKEAWEAGNGIFSITYKQHLTYAKNRDQVYSQVLQNVLRRLDKSFLAAFGRVRTKKAARTNADRKVQPGFPRFKSKNRYKSFTYPQSGFNLESSSRLTLSKIGSIRIFKHRDIEGKIKTCTLKRDSTGCWYAILVAEIADAPREPAPQIAAIGIDLGTKRERDSTTGKTTGRLASLSNGKRILYPRFFAESEERLKAAQKTFSRKKAGSKNREKARIKLAKIHKKILNQRNDFLNKKSRKLADLAELIIFERLQINGLSRGLNRAKDMHDHALRKFVQFTIYKAERAGGSVEFVNPQRTTKECSLCHMPIQMRSGDRVHNCPECGLSLDRDHVAAINILYRGLASRGISSEFDLLDHICEIEEDGTLGLRGSACIDLTDYYWNAGSL
jgi:putative transposase